MALSEKLLLRRIRRFIPAGANVLQIEVAMATVRGDELPTPAILTDEGFLFVTTTGATAVVTPVPFERISEARSYGTTIDVAFVDELGQGRMFYADFRRGGADIITKFFAELERWKELPKA